MKTTIINIILIAAIIFGLFYFLNYKKKISNEILRLKNNELALNDTIKNYKDKNGYNIGVISALSLKIEELHDSIEIEKNKDPITIIEYITGVADTLKIPIELKNDSASIYENKKWDHSSRSLSIKFPFFINDSLLSVGDANIILKQKIWLNTLLEQDQTTKRYYLKIKTDYPNITFTNANAIYIDPIINTEHKQQLLTLQTQFGFGYYLGCNKIGPYIGIGIGLNLNKIFKFKL